MPGSRTRSVDSRLSVPTWPRRCYRSSRTATGSSDTNYSSWPSVPACAFTRYPSIWSTTPTAGRRHRVRRPPSRTCAAWCGVGRALVTGALPLAALRDSLGRRELAAGRSRRCWPTGAVRGRRRCQHRGLCPAVSRVPGGGRGAVGQRPRTARHRGREHRGPPAFTFGSGGVVALRGTTAGLVVFAFGLAITSGSLAALHTAHAGRLPTPRTRRSRRGESRWPHCPFRRTALGLPVRRSERSDTDPVSVTIDRPVAAPEPAAAPKRPREYWALAALLVGTAVAYLWNLGASGWANAFYSAAVQAGSVCGRRYSSARRTPRTRSPSTSHPHRCG